MAIFAKTLSENAVGIKGQVGSIDWRSLGTYADQVESGLPAVKPLIDLCIESRAFYNLDAQQYHQQRPSESSFDWVHRKYRQSGFTRQCVDILCQHLYCPGPSRQIDDEHAEEFLEKVWSDNHYDSLMNECDRLSTLNDVVAIQIDAGDGDFNVKPITLIPWEKGEFWAWTDPEDSTNPIVVVTIDRFNETTTYRLWNDKEVRVYRTRQNGRIANFQPGESGNHEYGALPFAFVHYEFPHRNFWTTGLGHHLASAESIINDDLSLMKEYKDKYHNPICLAYGLPSTWQPVIEPGRWMKVPGKDLTPSGSGSFASGDNVELKYLQVQLQLVEAWQDITLFLNQVLESCEIPKSAVRMEETSAKSGVAIIAEQIPLLNRARRRRPAFQVYESRIASKILRCAGNHYEDKKLVDAADKAKLTLGWSDPSIPFPSVDRNEIYKGELEIGVRSRLQIIQEMYGCDRDRALEILKQIAEDKKDEDRLLPMTEVNPMLDVELANIQGKNGNGQDTKRKAKREEEGEL
jgi:hypothetical protein